MERQVKLAREALELVEDTVLRHIRSPLKTSKEIELEVERCLREYLTSKLPHYGFLGEEEGKSGPENPLYTWVCDPISSTKHLEALKPGFAVCLALLEEEEPVLAFVLDPMRKDLYMGRRGLGAFYNGKPLIISEEKTLEYGNFSCNQKEHYTTLLRLQKEHALWHKAPESWSLNFCKVARGELLLCFGSPKDNLSMVSGLLIAKEAGCTIRDYYGEVWNAQRSPSLGLVVSHNESIYNNVQDFLRRPL